LQADDIRALLIDAMPPDALPSCLKPQATVVSVHTRMERLSAQTLLCGGHIMRLLLEEAADSKKLNRCV